MGSAPDKPLLISTRDYHSKHRLRAVLRADAKLTCLRAHRWRIALAGLAITAVYTLLRLPGIALPLDRDEGTFGFIGQTVNRGRLPYLDALDHKPPLAFYLNALALRFVPPTPEGIHTFALVCNFFTLICLFFAARILFQSLNAALWTAFAFAAFSASPAIHGFTASTELYALLPTTLSLVLALIGKRSGSRLLLIASGVAGAAACWTKQTAFTSVLFVFLFACSSLEGPVLWLAGAVSFSAALALYFYGKGIFQPFIYWCFIYELAYASVPFSHTLETMQDHLGEIARGDFLLPAAGLTAAIWSAVRRRGPGVFLLGLLLFSFAGTVPGYTYPHYFVQTAPAVALAGGYALYVLFERSSRSAFAVAVLILALSVGVNRQYFLEPNPGKISRYYFGANPFPESEAIGAFLAARTTAKSRILIIGSEPQILFYAQRQSPSAFLMIYPLTSVHNRYREFETAMSADVQRTPPDWIVIPKDIPASLAWDEKADLAIVRNLCELVEQGYTLDRTFELNPPPSEDQVFTEDTGTCVDADRPAVYVYKRN